MDHAPGVDVKVLYAALDAARNERSLSWRQLAKELEVSPSTLSRIANGLKPDLSAFARMTTWLRMPAESFYVGTHQESAEEPELVAALAPLLRARRDLKEEDVTYLEQLIGAAAHRFRTEAAAKG